jgi:Rod binding domain-containing protein
MKPIDEFSRIGALQQLPSIPLANPVNSPKPITRRPQAEKAELEQTCAEFAAIFFQILLKSMSSTIPKSSLYPEFQGKNLLNSIVDQGVAQFVARDGAGLKEMLIRKLMSDKK